MVDGPVSLLVEICEHGAFYVAVGRNIVLCIIDASEKYLFFSLKTQ